MVVFPLLLLARVTEVDPETHTHTSFAEKLLRMNMNLGWFSKIRELWLLAEGTALQFSVEMEINNSSKKKSNKNIKRTKQLTSKSPDIGWHFFGKS